MNLRDKVDSMLKQLVATAYNVSVYGTGHKISVRVTDSLYATLQDIFQTEEEITIGIIGNEIAFEKEPFYETSKYVKDLIKRLKEKKAEKISFSNGVTRRELIDFVELLTAKPSGDALAESLEKTLKNVGIKHVTVGEIGLKKEEKGEEAGEEINAVTKRSYGDGVDFLEKAREAIREKKSLNVDSARRIVNSIITSLLRNKELLLVLTSTKSHDESTFVHDVNVAVFTLLQAEALGLEEHYLTDIGIAGLLHDAGKLSITGDILRKKGKLTVEEMREVSLHPADGAKILLETPAISPVAAIAAFEHHIAYDMSGYPERLENKLPCIVSMMVAIADCYDATRSKRYYREEMAPEKTYEEMMASSGKEFHPDLLDNFFRVIGVYPPGTLVELDTWEVAIVIKESTLDVKRPKVEILYDNKGKRMREPHMVDLLEKDESGNYRRSIVKSIPLSGKYTLPDKYV